MIVDAQSIAEILNDSRYEVTTVDGTLETIRRNFAARLRIGQLFGLAFCEQQDLTRAYPEVKKGLVLLRPHAKPDMLEGVYYPQLDCGNDSLASSLTALILSGINDKVPPEIFSHLWVIPYKRFIMWNLYHASAQEIQFRDLEPEERKKR